MNSLLEQLHDIEGLDPISWWPLAIGWWVAIFAGILIAGSAVLFILNRVRFKRSWKNDTLQKLAVLEANLKADTARKTVILLSEYLRRISLKRFARKECAGLMGTAWLNWLSEHDPKQFDWKAKGALLLEAPYAPPYQNLPVENIRELIHVTKQWVR